MTRRRIRHERSVAKQSVGHAENFRILKTHRISGVRLTHDPPSGNFSRGGSWARSYDAGVDIPPDARSGRVRSDIGCGRHDGFGIREVGLCSGASGSGFAASLAMVVLFALPAQAAPSTSLTVRQHAFHGLQVNIASVTTGVRFSLEPRQTKNSVTALAPVTADCGRRCSAGVNADFFNVTSREPIGGVIVDGKVLRSPNAMQISS